jgi:HK97 family phage major capsid protein
VARNDIDATGWLVEDKDSVVVKTFAQTSAWDEAARTIDMTANTVEIPRIDDMDVDIIPKGSAYGEDTSDADVITITAKKFGKALRIAEEDVEDKKLADYLDLKKQSAASSFAKKYDNAAIGTTAAANGTTVPFTSLYRALTSADASTGYTANANVLSGTALTYDLLSRLLGLAEASDYYDESQVSVIAHPSFRGVFRGLVDGQQRPLFLNDVINGRVVSSVFGLPIRWSNGAKTSATAVTNNAAAGGVKGAAGNPLLAIVNKPFAVAGRRTPFESVVIPGRDGLAGLTDEDILKVRTRRAAGVTIPGAHAIFEKTTA